jgi:hypothetical protein
MTLLSSGGELGWLWARGYLASLLMHSEGS